MYRWGYRAVRDGQLSEACLTNPCGRTTYGGGLSSLLTDPKLRPSKYWRCSNYNSVPEVKWEPSLPEVKRHLEPLSQRINGKLASRAASLSGFFAIFCDVSRNMYIFQFSLLWCFRKDCQIKSLSDVSPQVTKSIIGM